MAELRPYQRATVDDAVAFLLAASPGDRRLYSSPTGTGKSYIELAIHDQLPGSWIVTPSREILDGLDEKHAGTVRAMTPITMRNRLLSGDLDPPRFLIFDEVHHNEANSWQSIELLCGMCPAVGFTATPFRGTPRSTTSLLERWGKPVRVMTYRQAMDRGYIRMPELSFEPLVDDDVVDVVGGEFELTRLEAETRNRLGDLAHLAARYYDGTHYDVPTMFSLPSRALCAEFVRLCRTLGLDIFTIHAGTTHEDRRLIFRGAVERVLAFCHVNVVSEGVDLPLRRYVDAHPVLSPVEWLQRFGRITRPSPDPSYYVCLAEGSPVYTNHGWKPIERVSLSDLVWDGVEWVSHGGVAYNGVRECVKLNNVYMTPDHKVLTDNGWREAWELVTRSGYGRSSQVQRINRLDGTADARAVLRSGCTKQTYGVDYQSNAGGVQINKNGLALRNTNGRTFIPDAYYALLQTLYADAVTQDVADMRIMGDAAFVYAKSGWPIVKHSSNTSHLCRATMIRTLCSIASITTDTTNQEICGTSRHLNRISTAVYDLVNAGPRHRYQVGSMIVANCCNRNLLRHAYLLEGCVPPSKYTEAQKAFTVEPRRDGVRVVGLEALGRFKPTHVRTAEGLMLTCYALTAIENNAVTQYTAIVHPLRERVIWAKRLNVRNGQYGRWARCEPPVELRGFHSLPPRRLTEKMEAWYKRGAARVGLDASATLDRKAFTVFPVLNDLGERV